MYKRNSAVEYAIKWALRRNPRYYDFENLGGDCTNFVSQCLYAGYGEMNYMKDVGWYYNSLQDRAAAWTGVEYLYRFLIGNTGAGPKGTDIPLPSALPGDIIQLGNGDRFHHTAIITEIKPEVLVCAHSYDGLNVKLHGYEYKQMRVIRIG